jgi:hypothetical protein
MAETRQGTPLPESRQRPDWRTGPQVTRSGKIVDAEILGDTQITTAGDVSLTGAVSLTGVTTITPEAWTFPSLNSSWVNYGAGFQTIRYRKTPDGTVHIQGLIAGGTTTGGTTVFTLPAGYRPAGTLILTSQADGGGGIVIARTDIDSSGNVKTSIGWSATWTMLEFSFSV